MSTKTRTLASEIEAMQHRVFALRDLYGSDILVFNALMVVWQSLAVVWYAIVRGSDGDHLEDDIEADLGRGAEGATPDKVVQVTTYLRVVYEQSSDCVEIQDASGLIRGFEEWDTEGSLDSIAGVNSEHLDTLIAALQEVKAHLEKDAP